MFTRHFNSWCNLSRTMKRYFVNHFPEQTASLGVRTSPAISSPSRLLRNPMSNNQSNSDHEERNHYFTLQCFSVAGLMEILSSKPHDDENKQQLGEGKIIEMIKMAKLCHERKEFKKSEQLLHLALKTAYDLQNHDAQRYIIDDMANNAYEKGDLKKAEKLFINMMKQLLADGMQQDDLAIIHISAKLANLYAIFQEDLKAHEGFHFCINHLEAKLRKGADDFDTQALYSLILSWFGTFLHNKGEFEQSVSVFQQSHKISVKINGEHHPHSLLQLNNMAAAYTLMNRLEDALKCLNQALQLAQEHKMDDGLSDLPYYYINVTNIYLTQIETSSGDSSKLLEKATNSCHDAMKWARIVDNREALIIAKKCLKKIEHAKNA